MRLALIIFIADCFAAPPWHHRQLHVVSKDWLDRSSQTTCAFEECLLNSTELISYNGYLPETHVCVTEDGYHLSLHRISNRPVAGQSLGPTILLLHGLLDSSATYLMNGREGSLGFLLRQKDSMFGLEIREATVIGYRTKPFHQQAPSSGTGVGMQWRGITFLQPKYVMSGPR